MAGQQRDRAFQQAERTPSITTVTCPMTILKASRALERVIENRGTVTRREAPATSTPEPSCAALLTTAAPPPPLFSPPSDLTMVKKRNLTLAASATTSGAATKASSSAPRKGTLDAPPPAPALPAPESSTAGPAPGDWPALQPPNAMRRGLGALV
jgi:hypothetical protein